MTYRFALASMLCLLVSCGEPQDAQDDAAAGPAPSAAAPAASAAAPAFQRQAAPENAEVYLIAPQDGATVQNPVTVVFGLKGLGVAPAGVEAPNTGHHHLLIDTELSSFDGPIPSDEQHLHFGGGQTEAELTLPPGEHRLQLVFGDYLHVPLDPPLVSAIVTVNVTE